MRRLANANVEAIEIVSWRFLDSCVVAVAVVNFHFNRKDDDKQEKPFRYYYFPLCSALFQRNLFSPLFDDFE